MADLPSHATVTSLLKYDADTGVFTWKVNRGRTAKAGQTAGTLRPNDGYFQIRVSGKLILSHRLAWFYVHKRWPKNHIDHINGDRADNRVKNLRDVEQKVNNQNIRRANKLSKSGLLGAYTKQDGSFCSHIAVNGKVIVLGTYATAEEAHAAHLEAKRKLHEGCTI